MRRLRILVVDDDDVDRMAVRRALRRAALDAEIEVEEAASAQAALAALREDVAWDCVLLDLRLPGMTGLELLAELRAASCRVPVVMLTGHGDEESAVEAMQAGAADYLTKAALEPERLARSILHAVRVRDAERAAALAREQVEAAEQRYRFLADSIPQMVWVTLRDGHIEYVNRQWADYTGLTLQQLGDGGWLDLVHPEDREAVTSRWSHALAATESFEAQARLRRESDGAYRWHLSRATPLQGIDGDVRWFGSSTDIEEQKRAEAELLRLKELADAERRGAEESNRAKDEFLAVLSHELRTPLNAMLGWISMLRAEDATPETVARGLAVIDRNTRTQTQLIEDLLDVSRIVAGKLALDQRLLDIRDVATAALETVQPLAAAKRVAIRTKLDASPLVVRGDAGRLQQVVWNLLVNAVKFSEEGGTVDVDLQRRADRIVICVRDSGQGIEPSFLPHIFERFRQANTSSERSHGGLGLGLSIVQHLVERHGGSVSVTSEGKGHGAMFTVALPPEGIALGSSPAARPSTTSRDFLAKLEVLVVDDDDDSRDMLLTALQRRGAIVRGASSVAGARVELERSAPDLLISDLGMPGEDGFSLIREIRARTPEQGSRLLAIALTGYAGLDDQRRARAAGFDQHIAKPIDLSKLPQIIATLLSSRSTPPLR